MTHKESTDALEAIGSLYDEPHATTLMHDLLTNLSDDPDGFWPYYMETVGTDTASSEEVRTFLAEHGLDATFGQMRDFIESRSVQP